MIGWSGSPWFTGSSWRVGRRRSTSVDARYDNGVAVSWVAEGELVALADAPRSESI